MAAGEAFYHDKGPLRLRVEVVEAEGIPCVSRSSGSTCAVHVKIGPLVTHTRPMAVSHTTVTWNESFVLDLPPQDSDTPLAFSVAYPVRSFLKEMATVHIPIDNLHFNSTKDFWLVIPSHDQRHVIHLHVRLTALTFGLSPRNQQTAVDRGLVTSNRGMLLRRLVEGETCFMQEMMSLEAELAAQSKVRMLRPLIKAVTALVDLSRQTVVPQLSSLLLRWEYSSCLGKWIFCSSSHISEVYTAYFNALTSLQNSEPFHQLCSHSAASSLVQSPSNHVLYWHTALQHLQESTPSSHEDYSSIGASIAGLKETINAAIGALSSCPRPASSQLFLSASAAKRALVSSWRSLWCCTQSVEVQQCGFSTSEEEVLCDAGTLATTADGVQVRVLLLPRRVVLLPQTLDSNTVVRSLSLPCSARVEDGRLVVEGVTLRMASLHHALHWLLALDRGTKRLVVGGRRSPLLMKDTVPATRKHVHWDETSIAAIRCWRANYTAAPLRSLAPVSQTLPATQREGQRQSARNWKKRSRCGSEDGGAVDPAATWRKRSRGGHEPPATVVGAAAVAASH